MKSTNKVWSFIKGVLITLALPVMVYAVMDLLVYTIYDKHIINTALDIKNLVRSSGITAAVAFALSMNLSSGRMDLSLGAQRVAATICGGYLAASLGLGGIWILVFSILFGILFGGIVGIAYVTLRIPPMVLGIGMACILECVGFAISGGAGFKLVGTPGIETLTSVNFTIGVLVVILVVVLVLMTYTTFSYKFRAVRGSQTIAKNSGINIFVNVALCYTMAGLLIAVSGVLDSAFTGSMNATMGLTSNGSVMANMFPMMIGGMFLSRYINQAVGIVSASVALKIFSMGLLAFNVSDAVSGCINMALFIAFLVWQANSHVLAQRKYDKARIAEAMAMKAARSA